MEKNSHFIIYLFREINGRDTGERWPGKLIW